MRTEQELLVRANDWVVRMKNDGFPVDDQISFVVEKRQRDCFGFIRRYQNPKRFVIHLTPGLLELDTDIVDSTIIHEIIHSCPDCWEHRSEFHQMGNIATRKYNLRHPIATKADPAKSKELVATESYFQSSKLFMVDLKSGGAICSFRKKGTRVHKLVPHVMGNRCSSFGSGKWMLVKEEGKTLAEPKFSPKVTDKDKIFFNQKFASQGKSCYPRLTISASEKTAKKTNIVQLSLF